MKKATQTVNIMRPTFKNTSDRFETSRNPLTNKRGVDKKHNSYARYLARKKGKTICCCACTQLITSSDTTSSWSGTAKVGMLVSQAGTGATGIVVSMTFNGGLAGDIDTVTIRTNDCKFISKGGTDFKLVFFDGGVQIGELDGGLITVTTVSNCNNPSLPNSNLI
jgi:hypothetical protein